MVGLMVDTVGSDIIGTAGTIDITVDSVVSTTSCINYELSNGTYSWSDVIVVVRTFV